ncbi:MAG: 5-methylthioadenosine deaminase [Rhizobiales bacterium PAR1]|nr:MAG: 5-methylthioadenosine deaminase [Rhizobiales bacterium PAR1]
MRRTLIRGARVLTFDDAGTEYASADILIEGTKIAAIGPELAVAKAEAIDAEVIEAEGMLALPGLINAHLHSPANFQRGTLEGLPLELFMLYEVPPLASEPPSGRLCYIRTMLGAMEMLKLGITSVLDDAFYVPKPTPEAIDGVMQAYADAGIRATSTLDQPNIPEVEKYPFLKELLPADILAEMQATPITPAAELLALYDHLITRWHGAENGRLGAGVSCSAPQRVTVPYFEALSALSKKHDLPFVIHMLETKLQRVFGTEKLGKSLVHYVHDLGLLDERMQVVHAIWVDETDMRLMAEAGVTVAHNPVCNLKLGSGIMPFRRLGDHGIPICLGTDEIVADDTANLWQVAKMAGLIHKITDPEYRNWPEAREILGCLFGGGARAMRRGGEIGVLAPGAEADIILLDLDTFAFTPLNDLKRQLVYCENGGSVRLTMVAGEVVMRDGVLTRVDEAALKREARAMMAEFRQNSAEADAAAARLLPYYREMVLKAAGRDVGMQRWAGPATP